MPNGYDRRPLSEQFGFLDKIEDQYTEIVCKTSFGLRKYAANHIVQNLLEISFYDTLMRQWIRNELGVDIPSIRDVMERTCWGCDEEKRDLKYCKGKVQ